jgi:spermidine synthase
MNIKNSNQEKNTIQIRSTTIHTEYLILIILFFLSGFSGLIYESAWSQQLSIVFGSTELAIAAVLASYMGGLALGANILSRYIHKINKPIILYSIIEILIGVFALCVPYLLELVSYVHQILYLSDDLTSIDNSSAIYFILGSFIVLLIPTSLMGATLPLLSKYFVSKEDNIGKKVGFLYSINTFGACLGALTSSFFLLPTLGLGNTVYVAVVINVIIFIVGFVYYSKHNQDSNYQQKQVAKLSNKWILKIMLFSGAASLAYEILWTRLLSHMLGGSLYSFGVMLFIFLLGIALGAGFGSYLCKKKSIETKFAIIQMLIGIIFLLSFVFVNDLTLIPLSGSFGSIKFVMESLLLGVLTLLPGAFLIGSTFPLAISLIARNYKQTGVVAAKVYSWNTSGAIIGALLMGFYLLPNFEFVNSAKILSIVSLLIALYLSLKFSLNKLFSLAIFSLILMVFIGPIQKPFEILKYSVLGKRVQHGEVEFLGVGQSATVVLLNQGADMRLLTNGLPESAIQIKGSLEGKYYLASWLAMLPLVARPEVQEMLIIGLGAGKTLSAVPKSVKTIDLIELEEEVVTANQHLSTWRGIDPLKDPRLKLYVNDARSALNKSLKKYDAIVSQPSHPWTSGASNLYTKEFFALVKSRLNENGVFVQWIGMRFVDEKLLKSLLVTLNSEFQYVEIYQPKSKGGLLFLSSNKVLNITKDKFNDQLSQANWIENGVPTWFDFIISKRLSADKTYEFSNQAEISVDLNNKLKINSPKVISNPMTNLGFTKISNLYDPLIEYVDQQEFPTIVNKLLMSNNTQRAFQLVNKMPSSSKKEVLKAMISNFDSSNQISHNIIINYLKNNELDSELLFHLIHTNLNELVTSRVSIEFKSLIDNHKIAKLIVEGWRMKELNRWKKIKAQEDQFKSIPKTHPAYYLATKLRLLWRVHLGKESEKRESLNMINELIVQKTDFELLYQRVLISLQLNEYDIAIASIYELNSLLDENKKYPKFKSIKSNLEQIVTKIELRLKNINHQDENLKNKVINLKSYIKL